MSSISNDPRMIHGFGEPGEYGRAAYRGFHQLEQNTLRQLNDKNSLSAVLDFVGTSVRYTPSDTIKRGQLTDEGKQNLLGFADEFINTYDKTNDHALGHSDFYERNEQMAGHELERIDYELAHPQISDENRKKLEDLKKDIFRSLDETSAQIVEFLDLPDSQGKTDGLVTRDEAAAYFVTQDGIFEAAKRNLGAAKDEFKDKYPNQSWTWFQFKAGAGVALAQLISRFSGKEASFKMDGKISAAERVASDFWATLLPDTKREAILQNYKEYDLAQYKP